MAAESVDIGLQVANRSVRAQPASLGQRGAGGKYRFPSPHARLFAHAILRRGDVFLREANAIRGVVIQALGVQLRAGAVGQRQHLLSLRNFTGFLRRQRQREQSQNDD